MSRVRLTVEAPTGKVEGDERLVFEVSEGERLVVGRGGRARIACKTSACSREHCAIGLSDGALYVEDLGSSNGTWLNGQKVKRSPLAPGDKIHAGQPRVTIVTVEPI